MTDQEAPLLGLATNAELFAELQARARTRATGGGYSTVSDSDNALRVWRTDSDWFRGQIYLLSAVLAKSPAKAEAEPVAPVDDVARPASSEQVAEVAALSEVHLKAYAEGYLQGYLRRKS